MKSLQPPFLLLITFVLFLSLLAVHVEASCKKGKKNCNHKSCKKKQYGEKKSSYGEKKSSYGKKPYQKEDVEEDFDTDDSCDFDIEAQVVYRAPSADDPGIYFPNDPLINSRPPPFIPPSPFAVANNNGVLPSSSSPSNCPPQLQPQATQACPSNSLAPFPAQTGIGGYQPPSPDHIVKSGPSVGPQPELQVMYFAPPQSKKRKIPKSSPPAPPNPFWSSPPGNWGAPMANSWPQSYGSSYGNPFLAASNGMLSQSMPQSAKNSPPQMYYMDPNGGARIFVPDSYQINLSKGGKASNNNKRFSVTKSDIRAGFGGYYVVTKNVPMGLEQEACASADGFPAIITSSTDKDAIASIKKCFSSLARVKVRVGAYKEDTYSELALSFTKDSHGNYHFARERSTDEHPVLCQMELARPSSSRKSSSSRKKSSSHKKKKSSSSRKRSSRRRPRSDATSSYESTTDTNASTSTASTSSC